MTGRTKFPRDTQNVPQGTQLNNMFEIDHLVTAGGMGEVYKGHNIQTHDPVAIKIVLPEFAQDEMILELFRKEARILNHLHHEAIVRYYVFSIDAALGLPFLAMEFVDGPSLAERIKKGPLDTASVVTLQQHLADGLEKAHQAGVIHRDIAPDNIILPDGRVDRAKIIDFGIARSAVAGGGTLLGGQFAGKYNFVSPEQLGLFDGDVTNRSDIYSLGLVLAACALGRPLNMSGSQVAVIEKRRTVPDLTGIDRPLRDLIEAMLQPDPQDRPQSMAEVADWPTFDEPEPDPDYEKTRLYTTPPRSSARHGSRQTTRHPSRPPTRHPSRTPTSPPPSLPAETAEQVSRAPVSYPSQRPAAREPSVPPVEYPTLPPAQAREPSLPPVRYPSQAPAEQAREPSLPPARYPSQAPVEQAREPSLPPAPYPSQAPAEQAREALQPPVRYPSQAPVEQAPEPTPPPARYPLEPPAELARQPTPPPVRYPTQPPAEAEREPSLPPQRYPPVPAGEAARETVKPPSPPPAAPRPKPVARQGKKAGSKAGLIAAAVALAAVLFVGVGGWAYFEYLAGGVYVEQSQPDSVTTDQETPDSIATDQDRPDSVASDQDPPATADDEIARAPEPPQPSFSAADIRDYVNGYDGGDCFFVFPAEVGDQSAGVVGYGNERRPFDALRDAFQARFGFEAAIEMRKVTDGQCVVVDALDRLTTGGASQPVIELSHGVLRGGQALSGTVSGLAGRHLGLVILDNSGMLHNLGSYIETPGTGASPGEDAARFNVQLGPQTQMDFEPQLVLSVASAEPLQSLAFEDSLPAEEFIASLLEETARKPQGLATSIGYFMFGS